MLQRSNFSACPFYHPEGGRGGSSIKDVPCRFQEKCTKPACPFSHDSASGSSGDYSVNMSWYAQGGLMNRTPVPKVETSERVFVSGDVAETIVEGELLGDVEKIKTE